MICITFAAPTFCLPISLLKQQVSLAARAAQAVRGLSRCSCRVPVSEIAHADWALRTSRVLLHPSRTVFLGRQGTIPVLPALRTRRGPSFCVRADACWELSQHGLQARIQSELASPVLHTNARPSPRPHLRYPVVTLVSRCKNNTT